MSKNPNPKIPTQEWIERATNVLSRIEGKNVIPGVVTTELFLLHNDRIRPEEFGRHCSSCVNRVISRVKEELNALNSEKPFPEDKLSYKTDSTLQDEDPQDIVE